MAGHSKWANIKHRKAREDAKKGRVFSKLSKMITHAAREGGGDPEYNIQLKLAIDEAKAANMPNDNIDRAVKKGTGDLDGAAAMEEIVYEGYGPGGVAILLEILTDNRNRTAQEIRHLFTKSGGSLGESGCVAWMFDRKGIVVLDEENIDGDPDDLLLQAFDAGAEDFSREEGIIEVYTDPEGIESLRSWLAKRVQVSSAEVSMVPKNTVEVTGGDSSKLLNLLEGLEDHDDVQSVYSNADLEEEDPPE